MLQEADLEAAVAAGIVTAEQAVALRAVWLKERARGQAAALGHEERFQLHATGFNDFFFAIGIVAVVAVMVFFTLPGAGASACLPRCVDLGAVGASRRANAAGFARHPAHMLLRHICRPRRVRSISWSSVSLSGHPTSAALRDMVIDAVRYEIAHAALASISARRCRQLALRLYALTARGGRRCYYARFRLPFALLPDRRLHWSLRRASA